MFAVLNEFIVDERVKSSTEDLSRVIEEWENVFAKDVNLVLLKSFINIVNTKGMFFSVYGLFAIVVRIHS